MIVGFVGGPFDGKTAELPPNQWRWRVALRRPSDVAEGFTVSGEGRDPEASVAYSVGEYVFSWETMKMHWQEPKEAKQ